MTWLEVVAASLIGGMIALIAQQAFEKTADRREAEKQNSTAEVRQSDDSAENFSAIGEMDRGRSAD